MANTASEHGVVYEVRNLTDRWVTPMAGTVVSSHASAEAAMASFKGQPQAATDGTGRTTHGNYQAQAVIRVDASGGESVVLPPPAGGGLQAWPYNSN